MKHLKTIALTILILLVSALFTKVYALETVEVNNADDFKTNILEGKSIKITDDFTIKEKIIINNNQKLSIDLNGHTITFEAGKRIEIDGGKLDLTGKGTMKESSPYTSTITLRGSTDKTTKDYSVLTVGENVTLEGYYGTFVTVNDDKIFNSFSYGVVINVNGTLIGKAKANDRGSGIYVNGRNKNIENAAVINISKTAVIKAEGSGIYSAGYAVWNIDEANINAEEGISVKAGKFVINNAVINATGEKKNGVYNGNGIDQTGSAIGVESNPEYAGNIDITINGGTLKSEKGRSLYTYQVTKNGSTVNNIKSIKIEGTKLQDEIELAEDKDVLFKINKNADTKTYVNDKEVEYASANDKVKVVVNPKENTYVKNIIVTNKADSKVEVALNENTFVMPLFEVNIDVTTLAVEDKEGNVILVSSETKYDTEIPNTIIEELNKNTVSGTTGLIESINFENIKGVTETSVVEVKLDKALKSYNEEKKTMTYDVKVSYYVDDNNQGIVSNDNISGTIKFKLAIPNTITETHAKVKHISDGKLIDEKTYEIKTENNNKYVEIETTSFSEFELTFLNVNNNANTEIEITNPQTLDNIPTIIMVLLSSLTIFTLAFKTFKKRNNL